jgi:CubicO group peptidase (beta-lactamase class C family)/pimeloyl-ACP methyl ester carboxylesterase
MLSEMQAITDALVEQGSPAALLYVEDPVQGTNALAAGVRDIGTETAAQPTDRFRIASNSKTFTTAAIMLLREEGLVSLTNTVAELLPEYDIPSNSVITVSNLLTHTSGLPDHNNDTDYFETRAIDDPTTNFGPHEVFEVVRSLPSHFAPGTEYRYCDTGFYILALIIEEKNTNGWTYAEFIRNKFIGPLGLTNTFVPDAGNGYLRFIPGNHIRGYFVTNETTGAMGDYTDIGQSWDIGCGGMVSSTEDLATWVKALYGGAIVSPESLELMTAATVQSRRANTRYGMGTSISLMLGYGHSGGTLGYLSWMLYDPDRRTAYADVVNVLDPDLAFGGRSLRALFEAKWALGYDDIEDLRYSNTIAQVTAYATNIMVQADVPALSIALVDSNRIVWARGFGLADREADVQARSDTMYGLCSISKTFAAAAILKLQEAALLDLDDPVTNHVPTFALLPRFDSTSITVRQLLNHCSGMPGTYYNYAETLSPGTNYHAFVLETLAKDYLNFPPNFANAYNNNGFAVVEDIVQALSGRDYPTFVASNFFAPMGMLSSRYFGADPVARSYMGGTRYPDEIINVAGGGGVYSSALDMGQYIQTLLAWGNSPLDIEVLESNSVAALWKDETTNVMVKFTEHYFRPGLGWDCVSDPQFAYAGTAYWKDGASISFGSMLEVIPERGLGVIVLSSLSGPDAAMLVAQNALRWAIKDKFDLDWPTNRFVPPASPVTNLSIAELDAVTGCYAVIEGYDLIERDGTNLTWIRNAQSDEPTITSNLVGRENGWFSTPDSQDRELGFSNVLGRFIMYYRTVLGSYTTYQDTIARGERVTAVPLSSAWSNRLDKFYFVSDLDPDSYYWLPAFNLGIALFQSEGAIFLDAGDTVSSSLLVPDSDTLAFPRGVASAEPTALQVITTNGIEYLRYGGFTYQPADTFPPMDSGTASNLVLAAGETVWFTFTVSSGTVYTLDLLSTNHVAAYMQDVEGIRFGQALSAYGLTFTATNDAEYRIAVVNGLVPGPCQFGVYTNTLPFYREVTNVADWPSFMTNQWYGGSEFGYVHIPASRATNDAHSYRIPVVQLASGPDATNGAMIYLSGGPGSSAINQPYVFRAFTNTVRVIAMNQRGTYLSQPNLFPVSDNETTAELQQRLGGPGGMDFNTINTRENAADVHDVMTVLGNATFNVWGTSYGTMLSQEVIRQHPERIRAAVLDGVVKLDEPQWTVMGQGFYDALIALTNDVARDPDANRWYPVFGDTLMDFAAELYPDDYHDFFDGAFHQMNLSRWGRVEDVPGLVWRAANGEIAAMAGLMAINPPIENPPPDGPMSGNMYAMMIRHDMLPFESMTNAAALLDTIPFPLNEHGYAYSQDQYDSSEDWAFITPVDASFRTAVTNDVPVLVLNGNYDTQTPPRGAKHVATNLPHAYYVELPYIGHVVLFGGDVPAQIGRDFMENPGVFPDTNGISGMSLTFTPPWPTNAKVLAIGATETNEWDWNGYGAVGEWYKFAAAAGGSYAIEVGSPGVPFTLSIVTTNAEVAADGDGPSLSWSCPETGDYYAWLVGETSGVFTVTLSGITNDLVEGQSATGELAAGHTAWFHCSTVSGQYYGVVVTGNTADVSIHLVSESLGFVTNRTGGWTGWTSQDDAGYDVGLSSTGDTPFIVRFYSFADTIAAVTNWVAAQIAAGEVVGFSLALVDGQEIAWARGFGYADLENGIHVTTDTVFRIGSVSKMFTTTAAMQYRDQGKLGLDDSVTNYLPGLRLLDRGGFPGTEAITVRDLLDHHSGLPGNTLNPGFTTEPVDGLYSWLTNFLAGTYPIYPPGLVLSYCNTAFVLMEGVIEAADGSGTPFTDLVNSNVFEPLGMDASSYLKDKPAIISNLAKPYRKGQLMPEEYVNAYGTGSMYSRPVDLANYIRMILAGGIAPNGTRILEADSVAEMLTPQATNAPLDPFVLVTPPGLGWDIVKWPELSYADDLADKNGMTMVYRANIAVLPNRDLGLAVTFSSPAAFGGGPLTFILKDAVNDKYGIPAPTNMVYFPTATQAVSQAELDALAGFYASAGGYHRVDSQPGSLTVAFDDDDGTYTNMLLRTDGWFMADASPDKGILITNIAGRTALVRRSANTGYALTNLIGERFVPAPLSAAWSNRLGKVWCAMDDSPANYLPLVGASPYLTVTTDDGVLLVESYCAGVHVLSPTNDDTAFVCGLVNEDDSAVQVFTSNTFEYLRYGGYTWQPAESFPVLYPGSMTNLSLAAGETKWFAVQGWTGDPQGLIITNASLQLLLNLYTSDGSNVVSGTDAIQWICPEDGTYYLSVGAMSNATGNLRVYSLTNTIAHVTEWVAAQIAAGEVVGFSLALVDGQEIAWAQGFGYADLENGIPVTTDTVFRIGSVSKMFTTTVAMQYRDQGKLGLDDSITNYLPGFRMLDRDGFPGTEAITIRDLLDHHSGIPGNLFNSYFTTEPVGSRYAWLTNYLAGTYPIYPPRLVHSYCNSGFVLMEGVIEAVDGSGTPFTDLVNSNVLCPLGMDASSYLKDKPDIINNLAKPYIQGQLMPEEYVNAYGTGSMYSRPVDLANYIRMVLAGGISPNGTRILEADSVAEMLTPQETNAPFAPFAPEAIGLGWDGVNHPPVNYAGNLASKNGKTEVYRANMAVLPNRDLGLAVTFSSPASFGGGPLHFILQLAVNDKYGIPAPTNMVYFPAATQAVSQAELDALAGVYASGEGYHRVETGSGSLTLVYHADGDGTQVITNMLLRTDGWFSAGDAPTNGILITNIAGRTTLVRRDSYIGFEMTDIAGEQFDPVPISAAWSNRLGKSWFVLDDSPVSYSPVEGDSPRLTFATNDGVLLIESDDYAGLHVLSPTNDNVAFVCGLVNEDDSAVQVFTSNTFEYLCFGGYTWQPAESFPVLSPGSMTNLSLAAGETKWFAVPGWTGDPQGLIFTNASAPLWLNLYTSDGDPLANGINAAQWICPEDGTYYLSVGAMSNASGSLRAYSLTNTIAVTRPVITGYMARFNIPGVSVALVDGDQIAWIEHFGFANVEESVPVDGDTVFMIGSLSKTLTTLTALQLFDEGELDLDASVTNYIPEFSLLPRFAGFPTNITSRNMLDHHSGLPGDIYNGAVSAIDRYWPGYTAWLIEYFSGTYALYPPDMFASYCNSGFNIVAEIVARLDGTSFTDAAEERLFGPLGMTYSSFIPDKATITDNLATGYDGGQPSQDLVMNMPATGGAYSRAEDIAHVMIMLINEGAGLWTTNALAEMNRTSGRPLDVGSYSQCGLGLDSALDAALSYGGRTWAKNGSTGFFESFMEVLPDQRLGCIVLMNTSPSATYGIARAALKAAMQEKAGLVKPAIPPMDFTPTNRPQADLLPLEGLYVTRSGLEQFVAETNGTLTGILVGLAGDTVSTGYQALVNGRFSVPGHTNLQSAFTNIAGEDVIVRYGNDDGIVSEMILDGFGVMLHGSRFVPPAVPAAWSNRVGFAWVVCNQFIHDLFVLEDGAMSYELHLSNGVLRIGSMVLEPADDDTAYVAGLVTRGDGAVRILHTNGQERLQFNGYRCMRVDDIPDLAPGVPLSGTNRFHEGNWYVMNLPVGTYTLTCDDTNVAMLFYADLGDVPVVASGEYTFAITAPGPVYVALVTMSDSVPYELGAGRAELLVDRASAAADEVVLRWISQPGTNYSVQIATNLMEDPAFAPLASGIPSVPGVWTTWTSPVPAVPAACYRVIEEP